MDSLTHFESVKESFCHYFMDNNERIPHAAINKAVQFEVYSGRNIKDPSSTLLQLRSLAIID